MSAKVLTNLESVGEMIGHLKGIADALEEDEYIESLIEQAHKKTTHQFDLAAAATGRAGHLSHVFEFGTAGITRGKPKFLNPTAPEARLWVHTLTGEGGNQSIGYSFRPAVERNPRPTTAETGVPSKYLRKLSQRKYVFYNKAFVMETGQTVDIVPKRNGLLFIPFYGEPSMSERKQDRGYMMFPGNATLTPGRESQGTFQAFWMNWWGGTGSELIYRDMHANVSEDIRIAEEEMTRKANAEKMKSARTVNVPEAVSSARPRAKKSILRRRRSR